MTTKELFAAALLLIAVLSPPSQSRGAAYRVTELGTLGGTASFAESVNEAGEVVGWGDLSDGRGPRPFDYRGHITDAGAAIPELVGRALSINNHGVVVGDALTHEWGFHAVRYEDGNAISLGTLGGPSSQARAINESGQVVGASDVVPPPSGIWGPNGPPPVDQKVHAFIYEAGAMHDLHVQAGLPGDNSYAVALNDLGDVVGAYQLGDITPEGRPIRRAFHYREGALVDFELLGRASAIPLSINNCGQLVGLTEDMQGHSTAFFIDSGIVTHGLGSIGGTQSVARDINDASAIVGQATTRENHTWELASFDRSIKAVLNPYISPVWHAFVYEDGQMIDLNTLIPANSGWTLEDAASINESGQIVGSGRFGNANRAFLLTPVPEPAAAALVTVGALMHYRRRRSSPVSA